MFNLNLFSTHIFRTFCLLKIQGAKLLIVIAIFKQFDVDYS